MKLTQKDKERLKTNIISCLSNEKEVKKIIIFGSFLSSNNPNDIDIAVIQDSLEAYLPLALKYRKKIRPIVSQIPIDVFPVPVKCASEGTCFFTEIASGEIIYEK